MNLRRGNLNNCFTLTVESREVVGDMVREALVIVGLITRETTGG